MNENNIVVNLNDKEDYINKYNERELDDELGKYLLEKAKNIKTKQKIIITINAKNKLTSKEKDELVDMIRSYFGLDISEILNISRKEKILNLILLLIGFIFLIIYAFVYKTVLLSEILLIFGWIFVGEAICNVLYKSIENNLKIIRRKQLVNAKIKFNEDK